MEVRWKSQIKNTHMPPQAFCGAYIRFFAGFIASAVTIGKVQGGGKKVGINTDVQRAFLHIHQGCGDTQPQPAAFGVSGLIAPDKPLHQFVGMDI